LGAPAGIHPSGHRCMSQRCVLDRDDGERNRPIAKHDTVPDPHRSHHSRLRDADRVGIGAAVTSYQPNVRAADEFNPTIGETTNAHLGPGKVGQHGNMPTGIGRHLAYRGEPLQMTGDIAMRQVEAHHIAARSHHGRQHIGRL